MVEINHIQTLYDKNLFLQAFRESADKWAPKTNVESLPIEEIVLGSRLAARLGGLRLSRWLIRKASERDPGDRRVRFAKLYRSPRSRLLEDLRQFEDSPDLGGDDDRLRAHWFAAHAVMWASLRDFERAHDCINRGEALSKKDSWVTTCKADVLAIEDRWEEALETAEQAWMIRPGSPAAARGLGNCLLNLGRVPEAAERLSREAVRGESHEVALYACWHQCALAETLDGQDRLGALEAASRLAEKVNQLAPLADRDTRAVFARMKLDIAAISDNHDEMVRWAAAARVPFYRKVLENIGRNPAGQCFRLSYKRTRQRHQECLPTSVSSALSVFGIQLDPQEMASEITFGGTQYWAATDWLEKRGFAVRMFPATPFVTAALVKAGFSFVLGIETDDFSHAVNVIGIDEATGTVLLHDPSSFRTREYLLSSLGKGESPIGPKAMAVVPQERAHELAQFLPSADGEAMTALMRHQQTRSKLGAEAARRTVDDLAKAHPEHPITRYLLAIQSRDEGRTHEALRQLEKLVCDFPGSAMIRQNLLATCRSLGNNALMRKALADVVESGTLPGMQSQQDWQYPPSTYVCQFADLLRLAAPTRSYAKRLLNGVLRRQFNAAEAWHDLGDLLRHEGDVRGRLLAFRVASCLASNHEHYARSYCDALAESGKRDTGLAWLERRARKYGATSQGGAAWITWAGALEHWGQPELALKTCEEAVRIHPQSPELYSFFAFLLVRMGKWDEANSAVDTLHSLGNTALYEEAAAMVARLSGNLNSAIQHSENWERSAPHSTAAKQSLLNLIRKTKGPKASVGLAAGWVDAKLENDDLARLYASELERGSSPRWKHDLLLHRRVKRNPEDGWAWAELAFRRVADYERSPIERQKRLSDRVTRVLQECDRVAPESPPTIRAHAYWQEMNGEWNEAVHLWLDSIELEPTNGFSYRRLWLCSAALPDADRASILEKIEKALETCPGRVPFIREMVFAIAQRLGTGMAEALTARLRNVRPDDPDVIQASADLLVQMGQGRSDASRALELLEPTMAHFPYHLGLRFSLVATCRKLGLVDRAESELREIIRRFPGEVPAYLQLAQLLDQRGERDEINALMNAAFSRNPDSAEMWSTRVRILARNKQFAEARSVISNAVQLLPDAVDWRAKAVDLLIECGDPQGAVQLARDGVAIYPRGAYLWFLLGNVLNRVKELARPGEIEACFRKSLSLNSRLLDAADLLAVTLVEQRRYDEAETILLSLLPRYPDPSPVRGRLAWIERQKGPKGDALKEMGAIVVDAPWYRWGWGVLMEWIVQDKAWETGQRALKDVPAPFRGDTTFRKQRLVVLEKCGLRSAELEAEWQLLLADFAEDIPLHLQRYDSLVAQRRFDESARLLCRLQPLDRNNPFLRARLIEVLLREHKYPEAMEAISTLWFQEVENSPWPVDYSWRAVKDSSMQLRVYQNSLDTVRRGSRPTPRALYVLASYALGDVPVSKVRPKPVWSSWFRPKHTREVLSILQGLDAQSANDARRVAVLLHELAARGYHREVINYWEKNHPAVYSNVEIWAQVGYCILSLGRKAQARKHFSEWAQRRGVQMWMVTNYVWSSPRWSRASREHIRSTCLQALSQLPHDHSAKYLVHVLAESQAILDDDRGFLETLEKYRSLFDGSVKKPEYFEERQKYLLTEIPVLAQILQQRGKTKFARAARFLRLKQIPFIVFSEIKPQ
jgi:tetratricopeptide (TPR) repeat protein